jgi:CubicO group peptidase (beta-lactamase class C family)
MDKSSGPVSCIIKPARKQVECHDKLSRFLPEIPGANQVTLKNLLNMTSGYQDYVYQPEVTTGVYRNPFRQWTPAELIEIGTSPTLWFDPGKNFAYSHTNYVILGKVLEQITGMPLPQGMQKYIFAPMGLRQTQSIDTPQIPEPVMHSFSSERREFLHVPTELPALPREHLCPQLRPRRRQSWSLDHPNQKLCRQLCDHRLSARRPARHHCRHHLHPGSL